MPLDTKNAQFISPFVASPSDYDNRARMPSQVLGGLYHLIVIRPYLKHASYDEVLHAAEQHRDDMFINQTYIWLRANRMQFELGSVFGFIVYDVN